MNESKKYKKIGKCKICCQKVNDLKRGHIIPEWATKLGGLMSADSTLYDSSGIIHLETKVSPYTEYFSVVDVKKISELGKMNLDEYFYLAIA